MVIDFAYIAQKFTKSTIKNEVRGNLGWYLNNGPLPKRDTFTV